MRLTNKQPCKRGGGAMTRMATIAEEQPIQPSAGSLLPNHGPSWYAAYTWANHERRVVQQLVDRRIENFLPTYRSVRRWKDRRKELHLALFPSYVFVRMTLKDRIKVLQVPGVVDLVTFGGYPAPLPEMEIDSLRKGLAGEAWVEPHPYLRVGRRVRITQGPFAGIEGVLVRRKERLTVVLSIALIESSVAMEISESDVMPTH
jgi:transcription antitermination factor NusG